MKSKSRPLSVTHPKIARQAHGWDPSKVTFGEGTKRAWKCKLGHVWDATPNTRVNSNSGCSVCSNFTILKGFNDLATKNPKIAREAYGWDPTSVGAGSNVEKEWKCQKGHVFKQPVSARTGAKKTGCPYCASQKVLKGYNDISTTHPKLAKEADGWNPQTVMAGSHIKRNWKCLKGHHWIASSKQRTNIREGRKGNNCPVCANRVVLRGYNDLATTHPRIAKEAFGWDPRNVTAGNGSSRKWKCIKGHITQSSPASKTRNKASCGVCGNTQLLTGYNDLATSNPKLAAQASGWDPTKTIAGSTAKLLWKCKKGHKWNATIGNRKRGTECPYCLNHLILVGWNDLATTHKQLAKEADGWDARTVVAGHSKRLAWKCSLGHKWMTTPASRTVKKEVGNSKNSTTNCPTCMNRIVRPGFNDLATKFPKVAREAHGWDPSEVLFGSNKKLLWKCAEGHIWKTSVSMRTGDGNGCPSCAFYGFDPNKDAWVYFLRHPRWKMFQIGITNVPKDRLKSHKQLGWDLIKLSLPMEGYLAREWEVLILKMLTANGAKLGTRRTSKKFDGHTESWFEKNYPATTLKKLMDDAEKFAARSDR